MARQIPLLLPLLLPLPLVVLVVLAEEMGEAGENKVAVRVSVSRTPARSWCGIQWR